MYPHSMFKNVKILPMKFLIFTSEKKKKICLLHGQDFEMFLSELCFDINRLSSYRIVNEMQKNNYWSLI